MMMTTTMMTTMMMMMTTTMMMMMMMMMMSTISIITVLHCENGCFTEYTFQLLLNHHLHGHMRGFTTAVCVTITTITLLATVQVYAKIRAPVGVLRNEADRINYKLLVRLPLLVVVVRLLLLLLLP
jgi:hypothetical protein